MQVKKLSDLVLRFRNQNFTADDRILNLSSQLATSIVGGFPDVGCTNNTCWNNLCDRLLALNNNSCTNDHCKTSGQNNDGCTNYSCSN